MKNKATKQFPVILPLEHHEIIRRIAFNRRITMAEIVREAVREWIEKNPINKEGTK